MHVHRACMYLYYIFPFLGKPYTLNVQFCKCQADMLRLIQIGYWPATPTRPVLAFTKAFMDWMETLLLECQVSAQDFSCAIEMMVKEKFIKVILFLVMVIKVLYMGKF